MKAFAIRRYNAAMEMMELPRPEPGPGELLVRVRAAGVNPLDFKIRDGGVKVLLHFSFPLILGTDLAGDVAAIGPGVTRFKRGDAIYSRLDTERCRVCTARIFVECQTFLPDGSRRTDSPPG